MINSIDSILEPRITALQAKKNSLFESSRFEQLGMDWCKKHTLLADQVIQLLYENLRDQYPDAPRLAIIAVGGYGRCELAPYSDIDLTVVPLEETSPHLDESLRAFYRSLHQTLGGSMKYELGYAYRLISDTPGLDPTTRTGLLDARLVAGSNTVFSALMEALWNEFPVGEFILAKITERNIAQAKSNDRPLVVEPHIKEGAGGLRAFQCSNWIRAAIGERTLRGDHAYETLIRTRNAIHLVSGRRNDKLSNVRAGEISDKWSLDQGQFQQDVLTALLEGDRIFDSTREKLRESRFHLSDSVVAMRGEARILPDSNAGDAAVGITIATQLGISVTSFPTHYSEQVNGPAALYGLSQGVQTIRSFDRCGLLAGLLPELTECRTLLPGDSSHIFTVFEHTLQVVENLDRAQSLPFLSDLYANTAKKPLLYLAALLHDVGKSRSHHSGLGHSEEGAQMAETVCQRFGLDEAATHLVVWLVKEHLTLSLFLRLRDIENPSTIVELAKSVQTTEKLNMLALLTWADISAVNPNALTLEQEAGFKDLVTQAFEVLEGAEPTQVSNPLTRKNLIQRIAKANRDADQIEAFLQVLPAQYLTGNAPADVEKHLVMFRQAIEEEPNIDIIQNHELNFTEITVAAVDRPGLLSEILGVFYAFDLSVNAIKAYTTTSNPAVALDIFSVAFGGKSVPTGTLAQASTTLKGVLSKVDDIDEILLKREKDPHLRQKVLKYNFIAGPPVILECHCPRGKGMPFRISRYLTDRGINILGARVGQWAGTAAAAFYLDGATPSDLIRKIMDELANPL